MKRSLLVVLLLLCGLGQSVAGRGEAQRRSAFPAVNVCCSGTIRMSRLEYNELLSGTLPGNCFLCQLFPNCSQLELLTEDRCLSE